MSRLTRVMLSALLTAALLSGGSVCFAEPPVSASAFVLLDAGSGRVLLRRNETEELAIASTTKIMTALVALRHADLSDVVTVKREHLKEGSSMYLAEGEELTVEALLYGLMLPSGNDAAECVADHCGGVEHFVELMNEEAAALGMTHTSFANPSGLDAAGHYSCALDMARLMAAAMREPAFAALASTGTATVAQRTMTNHNKLLSLYEGCVGGKTGYTGAAGRTLVTCAERGGLRLVAVTLRDGNDWQDHAALYDYGFSAFRAERAVRYGTRYALTAVRGGESAYVPLIAAGDCSVAVAEGEELSLRIEAPESVSAPLRAGQTLGTAAVLLDGAELGRVELVAAREVRAAEQPVRKSLLERVLGFLGGER